MSGKFREVRYSGKHLILDLFGVERRCLEQVSIIESFLKEAADEARATILETKFHHFGENFGVTGVLILSESHISIHTWPEENYAAIDIFMCGDCNPEDSIQSIVQNFRPKEMKQNILYRGIQ